jgi:hypothetical protein
MAHFVLHGRKKQYARTYMEKGRYAERRMDACIWMRAFGRVHFNQIAEFYLQTVAYYAGKGPDTANLGHPARFLQCI